MLDTLITQITQFIISIISTTGYFGIFVLMTLESALIPIPSEITMPFAGFISTTGQLNIYLIIIFGALANLFGSILAYWLGYWGDEHFVRSIIRKYGKYVLISEHDYNFSKNWFKKYGEEITFFSRILPIVRTFISLPAGVAKMNFFKFCYLTFLGSLLWSAFLTYIGFFLGKNWNSLHVYYQRFEYLIIFISFLLIAFFIYHKLHKIRKK